MKRPAPLLVLDASTGHLSGVTCQLLDRFAARGEHGIMARAEGYFITSGLADFEAARAAMPPDLLHMAAFAQANDFPYILFDRDAPRIPGLPYYEDGNEPEPGSFGIAASAAHLEWREVRDAGAWIGRVLAPIPDADYAAALHLEPPGLAIPDGDHELVDGRTWITLAEASIRILADETDVRVTVLPLGCEMDDPLAEVAVSRADLRLAIAENDETPAP